jgi:hypothetical protein
LGKRHGQTQCQRSRSGGLRCSNRRQSRRGERRCRRRSRRRCRSSWGWPRFGVFDLGATNTFRLGGGSSLGLFIVVRIQRDEIVQNRDPGRRRRWRGVEASAVTNVVRCVFSLVHVFKTPTRMSLTECSLQVLNELFLDPRTVEGCGEVNPFRRRTEADS